MPPSRSRTTAPLRTEPELANSAALDRAALLEVHQQDRRAHLTGDADLLTLSMAEHLWEASRGGLNRLARAEVRDRFAAYFESVRYSLWDDLQPPHVSVSADGNSAWMAVEIEAQLTTIAEDGVNRNDSFESSWISVYEKHDGRWLMVGISSSIVDRS